MGRSLMKRSELLEHVTQETNDALRLPLAISVVGAQCGEANAFWNLAEKTITICYEDAELSFRLFKEAGDPDPIGSAASAEETTYYHELAHAVIDSYGLPFTGREEDVADQLVVYLLLEPHGSGEVDEDAPDAVMAYARMFDQYAKDKHFVTENDFADKHSMSQARVYNLLCWMYGSDPAKFEYLVTDDMLPKTRAVGCEGEFAELARGWSNLLGPHFHASHAGHEEHSDHDHDEHSDDKQPSHHNEHSDHE